MDTFDRMQNILRDMVGLKLRKGRLSCPNLKKKSLTPEEFFETWIKSLGTHPDAREFRRYYEDNPDMLRDLLSFLILPADIKETVGVSEENKKMAELRKAPESALNSNFDDSKLKIYIDLEEGGGRVLWDTEERKISRLSVEKYEEKIKTNPLYDKEDVRELLKRELAKITYNPLNLDIMYYETIDGKQTPVINQYSPPLWRCIPAEKELTCPKDIGEFIIHLIPDKECRQFLFNWIKQAIISRNETYLVLNGAKGIGKNVFCSLLEALVGDHNYFMAPKGVFESNFNGFLADKRVIVLDELQAKDDKSLSLLKKYANPRQSLEFKNKNVGKTMDTFNSYVICNNDITDLKVSPDDRRFSVVDLTEVPWNTITTEKERDEFISKFKKDPEWLAKFGHWILDRKYKGMDEFYVWRGPRFFKMVDASLTTVERIIVNKILSKSAKEYIYAEIRQQAVSEGCDKRYHPSKQKVGEFLQNYLHEGKYRLGSIVGEGKVAKIIPNEMFLPGKKKEEEISVDDF